MDYYGGYFPKGHRPWNAGQHYPIMSKGRMVYAPCCYRTKGARCSRAQCPPRGGILSASEIFGRQGYIPRTLAKGINKIRGRSLPIRRGYRGRGYYGGARPSNLMGFLKAGASALGSLFRKKPMSVSAPYNVTGFNNPWHGI